MREIAYLGDVYLFTASTKAYADPIIDDIDPQGVIKQRFYREVILTFPSKLCALELQTGQGWQPDQTHGHHHQGHEKACYY